MELIISSVKDFPVFVTLCSVKHQPKDAETWERGGLVLPPSPELLELIELIYKIPEEILLYPFLRKFPKSPALTKQNHFAPYGVNANRPELDDFTKLLSLGNI